MCFLVHFPFHQSMSFWHERIEQYWRKIYLLYHHRSVAALTLASGCCFFAVREESALRLPILFGEVWKANLCLFRGHSCKCLDCFIQAFSDATNRPQSEYFRRPFFAVEIEVFHQHLPRCHRHTPRKFLYLSQTASSICFHESCFVLFCLVCKQ